LAPPKPHQAARPGHHSSQFHYRLDHPERFRDLVVLLAARTAQFLNMAGLSNDLGVSIPTIKSWIGILEASQLVFLLRPYHVNLGSRLVKTPKLYFNDVGIVAHLTGITTREALLHGPLAGQLFENFVVQEAVKTFAHAGLHPPLFYYRTNNGLEVELLVEHSPTLVTPIEIKLSKTPRHDMARGIERLRSLQKSERNLGPGYVVCMTDDGIALNREDRAVSWRQLPEILLPGRPGKKSSPRQI
jgi:predicted AAA+ superfamily ATPase